MEYLYANENALQPVADNHYTTLSSVTLIALSL